MVEIKFVPATEAHARALANDMRPEEVRELALMRFKPLDGLLESIANADFAFAVLFDGEVGYIFGGTILNAMGSVGLIWGLGGNVCNRYPVSFYKLSRKAIGIFLDLCPHWYNYCDAEYVKSLNWLRRLGFEIGEPQRIADGFFRRIDIYRR